MIPDVGVGKDGVYFAFWLGAVALGLIGMMGVLGMLGLVYWKLDELNVTLQQVMERR